MAQPTNLEFVAFVERMVGRPYWYGTCQYNCTESLLKSKSRQYPKHYTSGRMGKYRSNIAAREVCADCIGALKGYLWTDGGRGVIEAVGTGDKISRKYESNGCPDKSANGMFEYAKKQGLAWGTIDTLPEVPGLALRYDGHVGYYVGGGEAVEWRGFAYGCVRTKVASRKWTHWYQAPGLHYVGADFETPAEEKPQEYALGERLLKRGSRGADVKLLQEILTAVGYDAGEADGIFGIATFAALTAFQDYSELDIDGVYGAQTHAALMAEYDEMTGEEGEDESDKARRVRVTAAGRWNIRKGPGVEHAPLTVVGQGTELPYVSRAQNGWLCVQLSDGTGWISPKCAEVVG